ncbi:MAG: HIT domain-containing protein [Candidatus Eisenbacteria bacterium]|nr:HIT domain-containing protein [Candidatus Eisenbacteria bacterium]
MARAPLRQRLWAPWRMAYIRRAEEPVGCLFCAVRRSRSDRAHLVLARRPNAILMLNRFPYTPGHVMIGVARHAAHFHELTGAERSDLLDLTALAERALASEYRPDGVNAGANLGRVAGAGFPGHLHLHLVPRWDGDTNFMPVIGETRVLPESLERTRARLARAIRAIERGAARKAVRRGRLR